MTNKEIVFCLKTLLEHLNDTMFFEQDVEMVKIKRKNYAKARELVAKDEKQRIRKRK